jgi:chromosome segregation ATPase
VSARKATIARLEEEIVLLKARLVRSQQRARKASEVEADLKRSLRIERQAFKEYKSGHAQSLEYYRRVAKRKNDGVRREIARLRDGKHHLRPAADALEAHILTTLQRVEAQGITFMDARLQIAVNFAEYREIAGMPPKKEDDAPPEDRPSLRIVA